MQEEELVGKINEYAERGLLWTPRYAVELAEAVCGGKLVVNWGLTIHPATLQYHTFAFFSPTESLNVYEQYSRDTQSLLSPCTFFSVF